VKTVREMAKSDNPLLKSGQSIKQITSRETRKMMLSKDGFKFNQIRSAALYDAQLFFSFGGSPRALAEPSSQIQFNPGTAHIMKKHEHQNSTRASLS
jgi:hypothetical protein